MKTWEKNAIIELANDEDLDPDDATTHGDGGWGIGFTVSFGGNYGPEYLVCEDYDDAERLATARVEQDLDDEPEIFNQDWLMQFLTISPTDIRIISGEEGDRYAEDLDDERAIEEADMEGELEPYEEAVEAAEEARDEYGSLSIEDGYDEDEFDRLDALVDAADEALEAARERLGDVAREEVASNYADNMAEELRRDPLGYFQDNYGWSAKDMLDNNIGSLDYEDAARNAVNTDGVAHFLSTYDGNMIELDGGAVAFRTN